MMKVSEALSKYADYEVDEKELEKILVKPVKTVWELKEDDIYYFISISGSICCYRWDDVRYDKKIRENGNCFLTEEDAEFRLEQLKVETELERLGGKKGMLYYGNNLNEVKWYIKYDALNRRGYSSIEQSECTQGTYYFKSKEECLNAINQIGTDRIEKYLFYIK